MALDSTRVSEIYGFEQEPVKTEPDFAQRRKDLVVILRDKTRWPEKFEWRYAKSYGCAIGLCDGVGMVKLPRNDENQLQSLQGSKALAEYLGLTPQQGHDIFFQANLTLGRGLMDVYSITPEDVAGLLEKV